MATERIEIRAGWSGARQSAAVRPLNALRPGSARQRRIAGGTAEAGPAPRADAGGDTARELAIRYRLLLYPPETCRLPRWFEAVRVRSGMAWVTHGGRDIVLRRGETARLDGKRDFAVVSSLSDAPLVLEVLATPSQRRPRR